MFAILEVPTLGWGHPLVLVSTAAGTVAFVIFTVVQRHTASPVLAPSLVGNRGFMGWSLATLTTSVGFLGVLVFLPTYLQAAGRFSVAAAGLAMLLLTAPVLVMPMVAAALVNRRVSPRLLIMTALVLVTAGNLWLLSLGPAQVMAAIAGPLLMIGVGMGTSFGITDGQAMRLIPAGSVGMAAGFLNTLRGTAEAMVIAVFSAALIGFLTTGLGDAQHAAAVSAGRLHPDSVSEEIDAFTWAWHMTQLGVAALCLVLSIGVAVLIYSRQSQVGALTGEAPDPRHRRGVSDRPARSRR